MRKIKLTEQDADSKLYNDPLKIVDMFSLHRLPLVQTHLHQKILKT